MLSKCAGSICNQNKLRARGNGASVAIRTARPVGVQGRRTNRRINESAAIRQHLLFHRWSLMQTQRRKKVLFLSLRFPARGQQPHIPRISAPLRRIVTVRKYNTISKSTLLINADTNSSSKIPFQNTLKMPTPFSSGRFVP